jgi:predicted phage terminase large subunit-like protein
MYLLPQMPKVVHSSTIITVSNTPEDRELREACRTDHRRFIREFFPHHFRGRFSAMHSRFCDMEAKPDRRGAMEVIAAPRGNCKTTFKVLIKVIHSIVYNYHPFILVLGFSSSEAKDKVKDIRDELATNQRLIEVYGQLATLKMAEKDFITTNGVRITARGRGGQVRGLKFRQFRPSLIIADDVESLEGVNTPEQRKKTEDWFSKDVVGSGGADGKTDVIMVGTVLHKEGLLNTLMQRPGWNAQKYRSVISEATNQELWQQWRSIYCNLDSPNADADALAFYQANEAAMLEGVEVLWPDGDSYYNLMKWRIQYGEAAFNSEKQNDPFDPDRQILDPDACLRFKVIWPGDDQWPDPMKDDGFFIACLGKQWIHSSDLKIIAFHDPAMAETNKSDYAAICVCAQDPEQYIYVLHCYLRKDPPDKQIRQAFDLAAKWGISTLYLESNGFQKLMKPLYKLEGERREKLGELPSFRVIGVEQHKNKIHRITTLEPYFSNRWLRLNETLEPLLIDQLKLFPTSSASRAADSPRMSRIMYRHKEFFQ